MKIYLNETGGERGPFTPEQVQQWIKEGVIAPEDFARTDGDPMVRAVRDCMGLADDPSFGGRGRRLRSLTAAMLAIALAVGALVWASHIPGLHVTSAFPVDVVPVSEPSKTLTPTELFAKVSPSVVLLRSFDDTGRPMAIGSGFFIEDGSQLVSNFHVVEGASRVEIVSANGQAETAGAALAYSEEQDLVILQVPTPGAALPLMTEKPQVGQRILAVGNPLGLQRTISDGLISGIRETSKSLFYQISAPISPGSSGGPVLDEQGRVVGIATFTVTEAQNLNFAIPASAITALQRLPQPLTIGKLPRAKPSAFRLGRGGLEIVKQERLGVSDIDDYTPEVRAILIRMRGKERVGTIRLSIKNTGSETVEAIRLRFVYYELPPGAQPKKRTAFIESLMKEEQRLRDEVVAAEFEHLNLQVDIEKWAVRARPPAQSNGETSSGKGNWEFLETANRWKDASFPRMTAFSAALQHAAEMHFKFPGKRFLDDFHIAVAQERQSILTTIAERTQVLLGEQRNLPKDKDEADRLIRQNQSLQERAKAAETALEKFLADKEDRIAQRTAELHAEAEAALQVKPTPIHFEDKVVTGTIPPGLPRLFEVETELRPEWGYEVYLLDHLARKGAEELLEAAGK